MPLSACYINLDRSPHRRQHMESQAAKIGLEGLRRFSAIDGRTLAKPDGCAITLAELACFQSHLQAIESSPAGDFALVMEDDVELSDDLVPTLHAGQLDALHGFDIVLLECQPYIGSD